jgi:hypothetical protein
MMVANFQEHYYVAWQIPRYYSGYSVATILSKTYLMEGGASRRSMRSIRKIAFASHGFTHVFRVGRLNSLSLRNAPLRAAAWQLDIGLKFPTRSHRDLSSLST